MLNNKKLNTIIVFLLAEFTLAGSQSYNIEKFKVSFDEPLGYQVLRGFRGRDIVLLGPEKETKRSTIFIEVMESKRINFNEEKDSLEKFKNLKVEWLKNKKGNLNKFDLDKKLNFLNSKYLFHEVYYTLGNQKFVEGDLYYKCGKDVVSNVSFLVKESRYNSFRETFDKLTKSLSCH